MDVRAGRAGMAGSAKARGYSLARVVPARAAGGNASESAEVISSVFSSIVSIQFSSQYCYCCSTHVLVMYASAYVLATIAAAAAATTTTTTTTCYYYYYYYHDYDYAYDNDYDYDCS